MVFSDHPARIPPPLHAVVFMVTVTGCPAIAGDGDDVMVAASPSAHAGAETMVRAAASNNFFMLLIK